MKSLQINIKFSRIFKKLATSERLQRAGFTVVLSVIILLIFRIPIEKQIITEEEGYFNESNSLLYFLASDLDNDGNSERIRFDYENESKKLSFSFFDSNGIFMETVNLFQINWNTDMIPAAFDIDNDRFKEILITTVRNDSVFLQAVNTLDYKMKINDFFVGIIENPLNNQLFNCRFYACNDFNKDGKNELYFCFDAGHGLTPRGLFRFDFDDMIIYKSPQPYIYWGEPEFSDIDSDGKPEIFTKNYAPDNVKKETEFPDNRSYIGIFDSELKNLFPLIPMEEGFSNVSTLPATFSDTMFFALHIDNVSKIDSTTIFLMNNKGKVIKKKRFYRHDPSNHTVSLKIIDNRNYLIISKIGKFELTADLAGLPDKKQKKQKDYESWMFEKYWIFDANNDGNNDIISWHPENSNFQVISGHDKTVTNYNKTVNGLITGIWPYWINGRVDKMMICTTKGYFFLHYYKNPYYWTKYLIWLAIIMVTYTITFLIQYFQRRRMEQKWETEKQLTELQFNTIRNQLNPHFIFNALNSVGFLIENGKKEEAYDYLSINARIIRKVLEDAELTTRTLEEEINFVKDYIAVQEFRFKDRYRTVFSVDENVNLSIAVPKMVLHTYVENSVKHGFKNTVSGGLLVISVSAIPKRVVLSVRDNGNFSKEDDHQEKNTGKGLQIMESYYRLFEKLHNCKIQTTIKKVSETNPAETGMEVVIKIEYF